MKKKLALLLALCLTVGSLAACGGSKSSGSAPAETAKAEGSEPITIEFWNSWTGSDGATLIEFVEKFNKENPYGITVNMDINSEFGEKLATTLPVGECSPLILMGAADRFRYAEYLQDVDDIFDVTNLKKEDFNENVMSTLYTDGKLAGFPFQLSLYYMYYNVDLLNAAGYSEPPKSLTEWAEMARAITNEETNTYGSGLFYGYWCQQFCNAQIKGGRAVTKNDDGTWSVNVKGNAGIKEYLEFSQDMFVSENNPLDNEIDSMFKAGQIGIMTNGPWLAAGANEAGINYKMCKIFGEEPLGDVAAFFITNSATPEQKLAAERFMEYWYLGLDGSDLINTGAGQWSLSIGFPTAYLPLAAKDEYKNDEKLSALALADDSADSIWIGSDADFAGFAEMGTAIATMNTSAAYGEDIDAAMDACQAELERIVVEYYGEGSLK